MPKDSTPQMARIHLKRENQATLVAFSFNFSLFLSLFFPLTMEILLVPFLELDLVVLKVYMTKEIFLLTS